MSIIKFFVAALAVAPLTLSNHYEQGAFVASSALAVAIVVGARPPWLFCAFVFVAAWQMAPVAVLPVLCLLASWCQGNRTAPKHRSRHPRHRSTVAELTSSNVNGARGLAEAPRTARARFGAGGCSTVGPMTTREQWIEAISPDAARQPSHCAVINAKHSSRIKPCVGMQRQSNELCPKQCSRWTPGSAAHTARCGMGVGSGRHLQGAVSRT